MAVVAFKFFTTKKAIGNLHGSKSNLHKEFENLSQEEKVLEARTAFNVRMIQKEKEANAIERRRTVQHVAENR